jgi:glycosyltransferase involved in cell wall biosynthesis
MIIALLIPDNRENFRDYNLKEPYFGTAPTALLEGFAILHQEEKQETGVEGADGRSPGKVEPFEIHIISCTQQPMPGPEKLAPNIWFHSLHVPKIGWLRTGYQGCVRAVRKKLREIKPDLVHAQGTERDCAISAVLAPYPRLLTIHGNLRLIRKQVGFSPFSAMWFQSFLEGYVVPRFDGVICITNYTKDAVVHEVPRTWVVPNAVDPAFLALGQQRLSNANVRPSTLDTRLTPSNSSFSIQASSLEPSPILLCVANIDARKNQNDFIRSLDSLAGKMSFQVRFFGKCGDDDYAREFQQLIASRLWCHYGGMIGREALKAEFQKATLLALPTHEDNCPMVVLEAQAAGVPVAASKVGGVPDLVEDEVTGLLVNPQDPVTFCTAVERLLVNDHSLRERLALAAHQKAVEQYHPRVIARKHLEIYEAVIHKKSNHVR